MKGNSGTRYLCPSWHMRFVGLSRAGPCSWSIVEPSRRAGCCLCATLTQPQVLFLCRSSFSAAGGHPASLLPGRLLPPGRRPAAGTSPWPASLLHLRPHQARDVLHAPRRGTVPSSPRAPKPPVGMLTVPLPILSFLPFCRGVFPIPISGIYPLSN